MRNPTIIPQIKPFLNNIRLFHIFFQAFSFPHRAGGLPRRAAGAPGRRPLMRDLIAADLFSCTRFSCRETRHSCSIGRECPTRQGAGSFRAPCSRACHSSPHSGSPDSRTQPIGRVGTSPGMTKTLVRGIAAPLCSFKTWPASMSAQSPKTIPNLCSAWRAAPGRTTKARAHPAELQYMTSLSARMASCRACSTTAPMTGGPLRRTDWRTD